VRRGIRFTCHSGRWLRALLNVRDALIEGRDVLLRDGSLGLSSEEAYHEARYLLLAASSVTLEKLIRTTSDDVKLSSESLNKYSKSFAISLIL